MKKASKKSPSKIDKSKSSKKGANEKSKAKTPEEIEAERRKAEEERKRIEEERKRKEEERRKEEQYKKLEAYVNESGLTLAFNIIFAELISKQILPENFFKYTAMRLREIGKEIEGMKIKDVLYVDKPPEEEVIREVKTEGDEQEQPKEANAQQQVQLEEQEETLLTVQKPKK